MKQQKCSLCGVGYERRNDETIRDYWVCGRCQMIRSTPEGHRLYLPGHYELGEGRCSCGVNQRVNRPDHRAESTHE